MRRFGRVLFNIAAAASLATCLLVGYIALVFGERSRCVPWLSVGSLLHFYPDRHRFCFSNAGRFEAVGSANILFPTTEPRATSYTLMSGVGEALPPWIMVVRSRGLRSGERLWALSVDYVPFCIVTLGLPLLGMVNHLHRRIANRRKAIDEERLRFNGRCVQCGYDLRGLYDQCPECGRAFYRRRVWNGDSRT